MQASFEERWQAQYSFKSMLISTARQKAAPGAAAATPCEQAQGSNSSLAGGREQISASAAPGPPSAPPEIRQAELEDEEDTLLSTATGVKPRATATSGGDGRQQQEGGEVEGEAGCRLAWDGSSRKRATGSAAAVAPPSASGSDAEAARAKATGNALLAAGDAAGAEQCYQEGIVACTRALMQAGAPAPAATPQQEAEQRQRQQFLATLYSNLAHAALTLRRPLEAITAASAALRLHPTWPKPLYRLAQARLAAGQHAAAAAAARAGERLVAADASGRTEFSPLLDAIAVAAAAAGRATAGFDGAQLEVRSAGEDAWLGGPAPHVPDLDGPEGDGSEGPGVTLTLPDVAGAGPSSGAASGSSKGGLAAAGAPAGDALATWDFRQLTGGPRRTSFRSLREAVAAARDGDRILLRRGTHNGQGECVTVGKRVLIEGEGAPGEAVIDQRANVPTLRIVHSGAVVRGLEFDHTGFREALLVTGDAGVKPFIEDCIIRCSGDDAVNVSGGACPTFVRCVITGKKCGLRAFDTAAPRLEACVLEKCGQQGVKAMEASSPALLHCTVADCGEDGCVVMDAASLSLTRGTVTGNKGPGVDCSDRGQVEVVCASIEGNVGGVFLWGQSRAVVHGATLAGGPCHALLVDGDASVDVQGSLLRGSVQASDEAWECILRPGNEVHDPEQPTDLPAEEGPFVFVPDRFTRKQ